MKQYSDKKLDKWVIRSDLYNTDIFFVVDICKTENFAKKQNKKVCMILRKNKEVRNWKVSSNPKKSNVCHQLYVFYDLVTQYVERAIRSK